MLSRASAETPNSRAFDLRLLDRRGLPRPPGRHACIASEPRPSTATPDDRCRSTSPGLQHVWCRACKLQPFLFTTLRWSPGLPNGTRAGVVFPFTRANRLGYWRPVRITELLTRSRYVTLESFPHAVHQHRSFPDSGTPSADRSRTPLFAGARSVARSASEPGHQPHSSARHFFTPTR